MPSVLIITYYWPPSGGSAVLRWLKFAKYLRNFGWEPVIYTPDNPEPQEVDESLLHDVPEGITVIRKKIFEPYGLYKKFTGRNKNERLGVALMNTQKKNSLTEKISLWIRSNLFIPDPRRFWVRPSVRFLRKYVTRHHIDVIITTGPPHSMHLIGKGLKNATGIKWVADFRDPWTGIDFYDELLLTRRADRCHHRLEQSVLREADQVITVSPGMSRDFMEMGFPQIVTITNGYDRETSESGGTVPEKFRLLHMGSMPRSRNPHNLWQVLSELTAADATLASRLEIRLVGKVDISVQDSIHTLGLEKFTVQQPYVPHEQVNLIMDNAAVLLLCINQTAHSEGILTNKFFEYLSAQKPILAIGPRHGDAASILDETGAGRMFDYADCDNLKEYIRELFGYFLQGRLQVNPQHIEKYRRKNLTFELSQLLNQLFD